MKNERRKLCKHLIQQDCYVLDYRPFYDRPVEQPEKYVEKVEFTDSSGVHIDFIEKDYPITQDSVNSYVDSTNYKACPEMYSSSPSGIKNDFSLLTQLASMDTEELKDLHQRLQDIILNSVPKKKEKEEKEEREEKQNGK